MSKSLTVYTNMPTPYQLDFFEALSKLFVLRVIYFSVRESDRQWNLPIENQNYETVLLKDNTIASIFHKKFPSFHFSNQIINTFLSDKNQFLIVNGTYWSPNVLLLILLAKIRKKTIFFYGEALFPVKNKFQFLLKKVFLSPILLWTNGIIAVGTRAMTSYRNYGYRKKILNIPYNIDTAKFEKKNVDASKLDLLRARFASENKVVLLTSSSLITRKGVDIIIAAYKEASNHSSVLIIIGDGPEMQHLKQLAYGFEGIHFVGFVEKQDIPYYFLMSDVFIFASLYDGWALVINEAIAAGLAIICSNSVGAAADKLVHMENAFICNSGNVKEYADAIKLLTGDNSLRQKFIAEIRKLTEEISSSYNAKKVYAIYDMDK